MSTNTTAGTVVAKTLRSRLDSEEFRQAVAKALPKHLTADRFVRVAATTIMRTPKLAECDQTSFFNCLLTLSQLGLEPDGRRAHLIPRWSSRRKCTECTLVVDYKGLSELALRSGMISRLHADVICEYDEFDYDCGELKRHRIDYRKPRGAVYAAYALVQYRDGSQKAEVMTVEEIEGIRGRSPSGKDGPWVTDWNEMAKKTVFRRLSKWLPLSAEFRDAVDADEDIESRLPSRGQEALVSTVGTFELPADIPDSKETTGEGTEGTEKATEKATETKVTPESKSETTSAQEMLATIVTGAGYNFGQFIAWAGAEKHLPDPGAVPSFADVPNAICARLIRAQVGMIRQLAERKIKV